MSSPGLPPDAPPPDAPPAAAAGRSRFVLRAGTPEDLPALRAVCRLTGDAGRDASALYADPDLLGDVYAAPYAVHEPALVSVLADDAGVCGYVLGCSDTAAFAAWMEAVWLPPLRVRHPLPPATDGSANAALLRRVHRRWPVSPQTPRHPAHLHIDLLPRAQGLGLGRALIERFLDTLRARGVPGVHLGVDRRNAGAIAFYERLGFVRLADAEWGFEYGLSLQTAAPARPPRRRSR